MSMLCRQRTSLDALMDRIRAGGCGSLTVIADFDRTLSAPYGETSWGALKQPGVLSDKFMSETSALYHKYHPIEVNHELPLAVRVQAMNEWWDAAHSLLLAEKVTRDTFARLARMCGQQFAWRRGVAPLLRTLARLRVPLLVFSAGLGDMVDALMEEQGWLPSPLVHVLSNHLHFSPEDGGIATRFQHANLHTFNKSEVLIEQRHVDYHAQLEGRRNVILLGDSLGDAHMAEGMQHDNVLRVGYLNDPQASPSAKQEYMKQFDVVFLDEPSLDWVNDFIASIDP